MFLQPGSLGTRALANIQLWSENGMEIKREVATCWFDVILCLFNLCPSIQSSSHHSPIHLSFLPSSVYTPIHLYFHLHFFTLPFPSDEYLLDFYVVAYDLLLNHEFISFSESCFIKAIATP